ncbi:cell wall elongation regulator TseB-like domain-containing protein [Neobacillus cucumis]|uniref:cell wall elongation regulator TseB-like domain-containing protein n=1 Tax=Neobacillus cucumis TaxID=1740721 RepID=UPI001963F45A|nr:DUF5590 domain-containing protein [Neobacillus cucumis]MBM7654891.1 uncharacterized protein YpmB [Neobacillus cucumis]MED4226833.1 DUF5590 domain-containing protein [Neobacillus cucumis]
MKKWIFIPLIAILVIIGILVKVYFSAVQPVKAAENKAVALAEKKVQFSEIDDFHIYHGNETVNVIEGKNKKGNKIIVWIPDKSKKVIIKMAKDGISKQEAIQKLLQETQPKKIISVRLGMEKNIPLWEIYYRSENNLINYYYVHFETGEWLKKIENL